MYLHVFIPAAKPSGPRTVRVVGVVWGRDWESHPQEKLGQEERKGLGISFKVYEVLNYLGNMILVPGVIPSATIFFCS